MELFKGIEGSPITYLASDISAAQTTISVADDTALPPAPNICTIGFGENLETIKYGSKSNGVLQEVTRGIEGTPRAWQAGTEVARFFTAYDHQAIINNMMEFGLEQWQGLDKKVALYMSKDSEEIKLDVGNIVYKDSQGVTRSLSDSLIVESGEDGNGRSYTKYADGRMICEGIVEATGMINTQWGSMYYLSLGSDTYIQPFVGEFPDVNYTNKTTVAVTIMPTQNLRLDRTGNVDVYLPIISTVSRTYTIKYKAEGRWKEQTP